LQVLEIKLPSAGHPPQRGIILALRAVKAEGPVLFPSMEGVLRTANARSAKVASSLIYYGNYYIIDSIENWNFLTKPEYTQSRDYTS
jgi:hypothetical protein